VRLFPFVESPEGDRAEKVVACEQIYKTCDALRRKVEPDWYTNILFLAGNQHEAAADDVRRFGRVPIHSPSSGKVKVVSNCILALARQAQASLCENIAQSIAVPATDDPDDVESAELATDVLASRYDEDHEQELRLSEILWAMCCGRVLRDTYWNPNADSYGILGKMTGAGDEATRMLNPFQFHLLPWMDSSAPMPGVIVSSVRDIDEINDIYKPAKPVVAEEYADAMRALDKLFVNIVDQREARTEKRNHAAILKELYAAPTPDYPKGKVIVWANGELLDETELPEGELCKVPIDWFPIPGRVYPLPFITPLRDLQREINITLGQLIHLKNCQLRGDIAIRGEGNVVQEFSKRQVGTSPDGLPIYEDTPQKVIRLPRNVESHEFLQYNLNTTEGERLLAYLWNEMMKAAGVHEPSLGENTGRLMQPTTLQLMKEADLAGLTLFRLGFGLAYAKVARHKLLVIKNHYQVPRIARVVGERESVKVRAFFGSELGGTEDVRPRSVPLVTETMKAQIRRELAATSGYDLSGPAQVKLNKVTTLLNSGLPGIEEEVSSMLAPMTVDKLRQVCAEINRIEVETSLLTATGQLVLAKSMIEQAANPQAPAEPGAAGGQTPPTAVAA